MKQIIIYYSSLPNTYILISILRKLEAVVTKKLK